MEELTAKYKNILNSINQYLFFDAKNEILIDLYISSALSIHLDRPIWLMIIAPPSSGKTELLNIISKIKGYHALHTLTPRHLFSGHPSAQGGYMIREVGKKGILAFPDFTTVLSMNSKARNEIFNQLRVIYDGKAGLGTGIDIGGINTWEGKVSIVATVTQAIDKIKDRSNDLGERFLYFYFFPKYLNSASITDDGRIKNEVPFMVKEFISEAKSKLKELILRDEDNKRIEIFGKFVSQGRAVVERSGYSREIENIHSPEQPYRICNALSSLNKCLICLNGDNEERITRSLSRVAMSSIPIMRLRILLTVYERQKTKIPSIEDILSIYKISPSKIKRDVEDLIVQKMLKIEKHKNKCLYSIDDEFYTILDRVIAPT